MVSIHNIFGKILFNHSLNDLLPVLPGNEQDLGHENKVRDIVCFGDQSANAEKSWHLSFGNFCLKLVLDGNCMPFGLVHSFW